MPDAADTPPLEDLLVHVGWIRRLSRRLVRDPDLADEVVQQTLLRATHSGPREPSSLRAWLGALVRNFARAGLRARARREHHEQRAARPERQPSTHEVVERAALHRELVDCVMSLDEPYRTTILLRYFEGQSAPEIAARQRIPAATVRTQLARGLALLRARLDREHGGDRAAWAVLALPLPAAPVPPPWVVSAPWAPLLAMNVKTIAAALVLAAAGLTVFFVTRAAPDPATPSALQAPATAAREPLDARTADTPLVRDERAPARAEAGASPAYATALAGLVPAAPNVEVRVVDVRSAPVVGVDLVTYVEVESLAAPFAGLPASSESHRGTGERTPLGRTDDLGVLLAPRPARSMHVDVDDPRYAAVLTGLLGRDADARACTVVVAPAVPLAGVVVDDAGLPVAGAQISIEPQFGFRARFALVLDASEDVRATRTSATDGRFVFERAPECDGLRLEATAAGHVPYSCVLAASDRPHKTIQLARLDSSGDVVRGRVVDEGNLPVPSAIVALGLGTTTADERGVFAIERNGKQQFRHSGTFELRALAPGRQPAVFAPPLVDGRPQWPEFVTLRLGGASLELAGRVEHADGSAAPGVRVWLADTTTFGEGPEGLVQVEGWLAGDDRNAWHYATTDADGRFRLDGLLQRDYLVHAIDPKTLERTELAGVAAGRRDVRLRFAENTCVPAVTGVVVDLAGTPVPDVRVVPNATTFLARHGGAMLFSTSVSLAGTTTDAEGRFTLGRLPFDGVALAVSGDSILSTAAPIAPETERRALPLDLHIEVERRLMLQIELSDPTSADGFAVLDADGQEMSLTLRMGSNTYFFQRPPIQEGRSHVVSVGERARTLVTYRGDVEVQRVSLRLVAGETTVVRL